VDANLAMCARQALKSPYAAKSARYTARVRLDAEVTIRRRQVDPQLRTVGGAQRIGEECQEPTFPTDWPPCQSVEPMSGRDDWMGEAGGRSVTGEE
jgi:hypothetical protein